MVKRMIFWLCIATWMVISMGCASGPKKTFSDRLEEARKSLAMIKVDPASQSKTTQQVYSQAVTEEGKKAAEENEQKLNKAFAEMLNACQGTVAGLESQGRGWGVTKVVIATVGTIAGAIVVPALTAAAASANAVWISAFGGVSGASNAAQQALSDVGFTTSSALETRQRILDDWKAATNVYFNSNSTYEQRIMAIQRGLVACTLYAITVPGQEISRPPDQPGSSKKGEGGGTK